MAEYLVRNITEPCDILQKNIFKLGKIIFNRNYGCLTQSIVTFVFKKLKSSSKLEEQITVNGKRRFRFHFWYALQHRFTCSG
ncbi:hypothetical protein MARINOS108_120446 [Marinoscillum sp. 108]|nr:hypothetical protein MARINOS108_120446 [Marinoscillum sp. 108]